MRILEIAPPWFPVPPRGYGGIELVVALLADGLVERGHDVTLVASGGSVTKARLVSPFAEAPDPARIGNAHDDVFHALSAYLEAISDPAGYDIVHDHAGLIGPALGAIASGTAWRSGVPGVFPPVVHTLHGPWTQAAKRYYARLHERLHLVAISEAQKADNPAVEYAGVVPNGINLALYPRRDEKDDYVLFLGRANPEKGPEVAVEVARRAGVHLKMVVKRNERFEQEYWDQVVVPHLTGDEEIFDQVSHELKAELLGRARATLFSIQWPEPFGLVMIESMACGTPVIATSRGAAPEVVVDGVTGFLCDSVDGMVAAVPRVGEISPAACRDHVAQRFAASAMLDGYERVFTRLATGGPFPLPT
jgi:glycosyltransferase involved in cell wall biosynthesis